MSVSRFACNKLGKVDSICHNSSHMCKRYVRHPSYLFFKTCKRFSSNTIESNVTEKASKDMMRVAICYAMGGTVASCFDIQSSDNKIVLHFSMPQAERMLLFAFAYGIGGCISWICFWSSNQILINAATSRLRHGFIDGSATALYSMFVAGCSLSCFSIYFDYMDYRARKKQYEAETTTTTTTTTTPSLMTQFASNSENEIGSSSGGVMPPTDSETIMKNNSSINNENKNDGEEMIGNSIIQSIRKIFASDRSKSRIANKNKNQNKNGNTEMSDNQQPQWNWNDAITNVGRPLKLFWQNNGVTWWLCSIGTGIFTARVMTHTLVTQGIGIGVGGVLLTSDNDNNNQQAVELDQKEMLYEKSVCQLLDG